MVENLVVWISIIAIIFWQAAIWAGIFLGQGITFLNSAIFHFSKTPSLLSINYPVLSLKVSSSFLLSRFSSTCHFLFSVYSTCILFSDFFSHQSIFSVKMYFGTLLFPFFLQILPPISHLPLQPVTTVHCQFLPCLLFLG